MSVHPGLKPVYMAIYGVIFITELRSPAQINVYHARVVLHVNQLRFKCNSVVVSG